MTIYRGSMGKSVGFGRNLRIRFRSRPLFDYEWQFTYRLDEPEVLIRFYVERSPLRFQIRYPNQDGMRVSAIEYLIDDTMTSVRYAFNKDIVGREVHMWADPVEVRPTRRVRIRFADAEGPLEPPEVRVLAGNDIPEDLAMLQHAFRLSEQEDMVNVALEELLEYQNRSPRNPVAAMTTSDLYRKKGKFEKSAEYALQSLASFPSDLARDRYQSIVSEIPPTPVDEIRRLQEEASRWAEAGAHGLVVLEWRQRHWVGMNGWHFRKRRELLEVRRPAAGRFLKTVGFSLSANEYILHTALRVIHADGEIETVSDENFTVSDSSEKNIFITVEDEKAGQWILPDLAPGDVVDWEVHLFCHDYDPDEAPEFFLLTSLFDSMNPTFRAVNEFVSPADLPIRFSLRNGAPEPEIVNLPGKRVSHIFRGDCFIPAKNTNFYYENHYLNPTVGCAHEATTWAEVAEKGLSVNFGGAQVEKELPEVLRHAIGDAEGPAALEQAFYWIRDKLKYASLRSGLGYIGTETRAASILESGTGDCKDKTYLLAIVCEVFGIPYEYVLVSTKRGLLVEELPAQQFDHVFLRARVEDRWAYLDAANSIATFGSPPAWCQGIQGMILDDHSLLTIPTDAPADNLIEITETFDTVADGWLEGTFDFRARGISGRLANERVKGLSLMVSDSRQATQEGLSPYLPFLAVMEHSLNSDTGSSGLFHVSGRHRRSPLALLGKNRRRVGRLAWNSPPLPVGYWRNLPLDHLFVMDFPIRIDVEVSLWGDLIPQLDDMSHVQDLENDLCTIREAVERGKESITVRRSLAFREKFVKGDRLAQVAPSMDAIEQSLLLVLSLDGDSSPKKNPG